MSLETLVQEYNSAFEQEQYSKVGQLLPRIKLELAKEGLLVPKTHASTQDLLKTRDILEKGILASIHLRNESEFVRLISEIHPFFYSKNAHGVGLPKSENQYKIMALYLLLLLSQNQIAEFHTELETLDDLNSTLEGGQSNSSSASPLETDIYLRYPVLLEQWLMEGSYHKVWKAITDPNQVPAREFGILAESLLFTVRDEIARSAEAAYDYLPMDNACHLLYLETVDELIKFAESQETGWVVDKLGKKIIFPNLNEGPTAPSSIANSTNNSREELLLKNENVNDLKEDFDVTGEAIGNASSQPEAIIAQCLDYAREMETII